MSRTKDLNASSCDSILGLPHDNMIPMRVSVQHGARLLQVDAGGGGGLEKILERATDNETAVDHDLPLALDDDHVARASPANQLFLRAPLVEIDVACDFHLRPPGPGIDRERTPGCIE